MKYFYYKKIIGKHCQTGNIIISDSWPAYNWLDDIHSGYQHVKHNHSIGSFGNSINSSSYIENTWANIKNKSKNLNHIFPNQNCILF